MKKSLILMFVVTLVLCLSISAYADAMLVKVGSATVNAGEEATVQIPVEITENVGIFGIQFVVDFAEGLTFENAKLVSGVPFTLSKKADGQKVTFLLDGEDFYYADGAFLNLTVSIAADTPAGEYDVNLSEVITTDTDFNDYYPQSQGGIITVKGNKNAIIEAAGSSLMLDGGIEAKVYYNYNGEATLFVDGTEAVKDEEKGLYYITKKVAPKNYKDVITFTATAEDVEEDVVIETSVIDMIEQYKDVENYPNETPLAIALENYCEQADIYFNGKALKTVTLTNAEASRVKRPVSIPEAEKTLGNVKFASTSLILEGKVTLRHYFKKLEGFDYAEFSTYNGTIGTDASGNFVYVEIENISAHELDKNQAVKVKYGDKELTVNFSVLNYVALHQNDNDEKGLSNLVKALCKYYAAGDEYVNPSPKNVEENEIDSTKW